MGIEVKPGRWQMRNGEMAKVLYDGGMMAWPWRGLWNGHVMTWSRGGMFGMAPGPMDLVEYLGPEEPQATS